MTKVHTIGICAPSGKFDKVQFKKGLDLLHQLGFETSIPPQIYQAHRYLAASDQDRADSIVALLESSHVDALMCARGGFGALKILNQLPWEVFRRFPKPLIGFSDATALLLTMIEKTGNHAIHGPMVTTLANSCKDTIAAFVSMLNGEEPFLELIRPRVLLPGDAHGILKGGNLTTICSMAGTAFQPDFERCILFLEDISEPPYKIERMLTQIQMAGMFKGLRGLVLGSFQNCGSLDDIDEVFCQIMEPLNIPVVGELPCGHGKQNLPLLMGIRVRLNSSVPEIYRI